MTRTELQQVRAALWNVRDCTDCDICNDTAQKALAILDAELSNPEALEARQRVGGTFGS